MLVVVFVVVVVYDCLLTKLASNLTVSESITVTVVSVSVSVFKAVSVTVFGVGFCVGLGFLKVNKVAGVEDVTVLA